MDKTISFSESKKHKQLFLLYLKKSEVNKKEQRPESNKTIKSKGFDLKGIVFPRINMLFNCERVE